MNDITVTIFLVFIALGIVFGLIITDKISQSEFYAQMDGIKGDIFSHIDKNTTNTEIVDMINSKCDARFTDGYFFNKKTVCVRELQDLFIISARD